MSEPYGLPPGTAINYGVPWPNPWVDALCRQWGLDSSTYPGHQESDRPDIGAAPNPDHLNRGIDWAGDPQRMLDFAHWLRDNGPDRTPGQYGPPGLEMVIYQDPRTGERVGYPSFVDYGGDYSGHTDHVHTRQSASLIDVAPPPLSREDRYAVLIIQEGQRRNISKRGICIALTVPFVESGYQMYANSNVPESLSFPHDAIGFDHDSTGLFQQRQAWGPLSCTMDAACSAGLFFDGGMGGQRGLTDFPYDDESNSPGFYAQSVQVSAYPDRYDQHWDEAVALYNRLAGTQPPTEEDELADPQIAQMIRELHAAAFDREVSNARYADQVQRWTHEEFGRHADGFLWDFTVEHDAALGDAEALARIQSKASAGDVKAVNFLRQLNQPRPQPTSTPPAIANDTSAIVDALRQENAALRDEIARLQTQPGTAVVAANGQPAGFGQVVGKLYDTIEQLHLADALDIAERATLSATIKILEAKNGTIQ